MGSIDSNHWLLWELAVWNFVLALDDLELTIKCRLWMSTTVPANEWRSEPGQGAPFPQCVDSAHPVSRVRGCDSPRGSSLLSLKMKNAKADVGTGSFLILTQLGQRWKLFGMTKAGLRDTNSPLTLSHRLCAQLWTEQYWNAGITCWRYVVRTWLLNYRLR